MTSADTAPAFSCERLKKGFGRLSVLKGLSLAVAAGECVTMFGRNGAGKSTLLNIASTASKTYQGSAYLFGDDLRKASAETRARIGVVSHDSFCYVDLTVTENLVFFARLYSIPDPEARAQSLIERFDLTSKARATVMELSRGMKQRVALARASIHEPLFLLLDEPFTGLDEKSCASVGGVIKDTTGRGGSVMLTTHDIDRGLAVADRAVILENGVIAYEATGDDLQPETFRKRYAEVAS